MIPSAPNPTGDNLSAWQTGDSWVNHPTAAAAAYHSSLASSSGPTATAPASSVSDPSSVGLALHRHQILDWENAMLLATHHSTTPSSAPTNSARDSLYDHVASDYSKTAGISLLQADSLSSFSHPRHYEDLLSAHMTPSANSGNFASRDAWGLLNTVCSRPGGSGNLQQDGSLLQQSAAQFSGYDNFNGADSLAALGNLGAAAAAGLYVDSVRSGGTNGYMGLNSFDQRRLDDIMKRELYTTQADFSSSRLGLNLGGRTYFSSDDFAFGRWGKRSRPNSPGCLMQPAPLCQAEGCKADLSMAKHYHRRHKVCEYHSKAATVHIGHQTQRFCQQCSRFHVLDEFDDGKRSCRKRLADHNRRRRKPQPTPMTSSTTSTGALAADTAITTTAEQDQIKDGSASAASDHARSKETTSSQEAATGVSDSSNDASGTPSGKASPTPAAAEDEQTKSMRAACSSASQKEEGSATAAQGDLSNHTSISAARGVLTLSGGSQQRADMAMTSSKTSPVAAGLLLGGGADNLNGKPANEAIEESAISTREGGSVENSLASSKQAALIMPWLQASSKKKQPYEEHPRTGPAGSGAGADYARLASFKAMSSAKFTDINAARGSWMSVRGAGADCNASDLLLNARYGDGSKPAGGGEAGSHELLCLLSDEGELLNANKQGSSTSGSSIATLAFLDQPLDQAGFPSSDHQHHRMLPFPGLQNADQERQASMPLSQGPSTTMAFGGLSHMM